MVMVQVSEVMFFMLLSPLMCKIVLPAYSGTCKYKYFPEVTRVIKTHPFEGWSPKEDRFGTCNK
jgi:hypothetical protein